MTALTPGPQAVSMVKTQKKQRKEGTNDFDSTSRDRDDSTSRDRQSPAYSDISDDSTPVTESEISGKFFANRLHTHLFSIHVKNVYFSLNKTNKQKYIYHTNSC